MTPTPSHRVLAALLGLGLGLLAAPLAPAQAATPTKAGHHHAKAALLPGYKTEAEARTGCGAGGIVWRAHDSKVFHLPKSRYFGKTKGGTFVCQKAAEAKGLHAAKS